MKAKAEQRERDATELKEIAGRKQRGASERRAEEERKKGKEREEKEETIPLKSETSRWD